MNFLHIGGGAGDLDPAANFRDGFSEFVKKYKIKNKNIFIVEANPANILTLKKSWAKYNSVKIFNIAISNKKKKKIRFYFSEKDAPYYQLFSNNINHVKKHFPKSKIKKKIVNSIEINKFLEMHFLNKKIDFFSIDIEGSDYNVLMKLDLKRYQILINVKVILYYLRILESLYHQLHLIALLNISNHSSLGHFQ